MATIFETLKGTAATVSAWALPKGDSLYLETTSIERKEADIREIFDHLTSSQQGQVFGKVWELGKMEDPRIAGEHWGEEHCFDSLPRVTAALHRLGFLEGVTHLHPVSVLSFDFGEGGLGAQYFSLGEKLGTDPVTGEIGYTNGMGVPTLEHAGRDAAYFSNHFADKNNIHVVYNATHQKTPSGDLGGFIVDAIRMKALDGGRYGKTSYLIAQQWIDYLNKNPDHKYLHVAHSEGAAHTNAALRLIYTASPDLLERIRVLTFCPGHFIDPATYKHGLQVRNFVKKEDGVINPWAKGANRINEAWHIYVVPHTGDHPHNHLSEDYRIASRECIAHFMCDGDIY